MAGDPYKYFRIEGRELLAGLSSALLELEKGRTPELVQRALRLAHTLKGAARVVKQKEIGDLAHRLEDKLVPLREGSNDVARGDIDEALGLVDQMVERLRLLSPEVVAPAANESAQTETSTVVAPAAQEHLVRADAEELEALSDGIVEVSSRVVALRRTSEALSRAVTLSSALADLAPARVGASERVRGAGLLDELRQLLAGLDRDTSTLVEQLERELSQVREAADRLRLLPAAVIFPRLARSLRDAAVSLGREVSLETRGGDVRLEPEVLSALEQCLVQLVRNSVAHGIEPPSERVDLGKPARGRVEIAISRRGSQLVASCTDDGRGIDLEAGRRALVARGMSVAETEHLELRELLLLLSKGGVSTASQVTSVSGRGVGVDVVRHTVERLGGAFEVESTSGKGSTFRLVVPVSVSAMDALLVTAGERHLALPLASVRQTLALPEGAVNAGPRGESIVFEGKLIPFARLGQMLGDPLQVDKRRACSVVVLEAQGARAAVGVGRILGTEHVVARALPRWTPALRLVAAATLDEEGAPRLVLDPGDVVAAAVQAPPAAEGPKRERAPILVIDDSLTTRMLEQSILESAGYEVETATSAEEGMQKAQEKTYALFLVDVEMPGMDGFTFVERSRAMPGLRDVPAILVTSRNSPEDKRRGEQAGASGYVVKGEFDQNALLERIRRLVG